MAEVESNKGKKKLVDNGFQFVFDKCSKDGDRMFWRCDQKQNGCPVRLHTDSTTQRILTRMHDHNHGSDVARVEVSRLRTAIKRRAEETVEVCQRVLCNCMWIVLYEVGL